MSNRSNTLQITRLLKHDRTRVFSALTDPVKMELVLPAELAGTLKLTSSGASKCTKLALLSLIAVNWSQLFGPVCHW